MDFTLNKYSQLLQTLLAQGFKFQPFAAFMQASASRSIILRHDVDKRSGNALKTARLEHDLCIPASYYFRAVPESWDEAIIRKIAGLGHEIGYHYENLTACKGDPGRAWEDFKANLEKLRGLAPVKTICMHGSPLSCHDNRDLWKHYDYHDFGIIGEPYFDVDFKKVFYITDTGRKWNNEGASVRDRVESGFDVPIKSTFHFIELAKSGALPQQMMITVHPQRWHDKPVPWLKELVGQNIKNVIKAGLIKWKRFYGYNILGYKGDQKVLRILIGIGHPADVHFFKHFINEMKSRGHEVFVSAREKEFTCYLLEKYNIPYYLVSSHQKTLIRKTGDYFLRWGRTRRFCQCIKPDIAIGVGDFYLAQVGALLGFETVLITDTEAARYDFLLSFPFAKYVLTPSCYKQSVNKQIRYNSYNELAYLSPKRFSPDRKIYDALGIPKDQRYLILRFTARTAVHDIGCGRLAPEIKIAAVKAFSKYARVFITSEQKLPAQLQTYQIPCAPEKIHDALYYADLIYGDSATMASEAACLGTPAIYVDDRGRGYTDEQERKYGLVFNFSNSREDQVRSVRKGIEILKMPEGSRKVCRDKAERMIGEKIDLTEFLVEMVLGF